MLYIKNVTIHSPFEAVEDGAVLIDAGQIVAVGPAAEISRSESARVIDGHSLLLAPGFVDLQINGAFGYDFTHDPESIWPVAEMLPRYGVTAFLPTIITSPLATVARAQTVVNREPAAGFRGARPLGLHVEGPFLNPAKKGAHNPAYLREPDLQAAATWSPAAGVRLVTLAPELPGATELITSLVGRGVTVSAGHSAATFAEAKAGIDAGIRYGTHLFNAMSALHHRQPGLIGALLTDDRVRVGLIADGIHTHPAVVDLAWRTLGPQRLTLVTDAMAALGLPAGRSLLSDREVIVDDTGVRLPDGTLAGSILSTDAALRNLMAFTGCSLADALATVTTTPAAVLGMEDHRGRIAPGYAADLVLLTPDLEVAMTIIGGKVVYTNGHYAGG